MPRIRTVKPEFWGHPKTARLTRDARLLFLGLLNESDDHGRQLGSLKRIAGAVFPNDADVTPKRVGGWIDELEREDMARRYTVDGVDYLLIVGFEQHQKVAHASPSRLPPPPSGEPHDRLTNNSGTDREPLNPYLGSPPGGAAPSTNGHHSTTEKLVAGYVTDYRATHHDRDPSSAWKGQAGKAVKAALADGADAGELELCLAAIAKESKSPGVLAHVLADYQAREVP